VTPALLEEGRGLLWAAEDEGVRIRVEVLGDELGEEGRRGGGVLRALLSVSPSGF
jgi:hypothetical protein